MRVLFALILFLITFSATAETVTLTGLAPAEIGNTAKLLRIQDYISNKTETIAESQVLTDSTFTIIFDETETYEAMLQIGNSYGYIYIQPGGSYKLLYPSVQNQGKSMRMNNISLIFEELPDTSDANFQILDYNYRLDGFLGNTFDFIANPEWHQRLENFKSRMAPIYRDESDFVKQYITYSVAEIEQIGHMKTDVRKSKSIIFGTYFHEKPILYNNVNYMKLFNQFYSKAFAQAPTTLEKRLYKAVMLEQRDTLMHLLEKDNYMKNEQLRELILIKALSEVHRGGEYPKKNIENILTDIEQNSKYKEHMVIAANVKRKLIKLQRGSLAPELTLKNQFGETVKLSDFKGKYVYLTFYQESFTKAVAEMKIIPQLIERYGDKEHIEIISICFDENEEDMKAFVKENKDFTWNFLHAGYDEELIELYDIRDFPKYVLLDDKGRILQSTAYAPTPSGNQISIDKTFFEINKRYEWEAIRGGN